MECPVCRGIIKEEEATETCLHCETLFHKEHFLEWKKVKGTCPLCKDGLVIPELPTESLKAKKGAELHDLNLQYGEALESNFENNIAKEFHMTSALMVDRGKFNRLERFYLLLMDHIPIAVLGLPLIVIIVIIAGPPYLILVGGIAAYLCLILLIATESFVCNYISHRKRNNPESN